MKAEGDSAASGGPEPYNKKYKKTVRIKKYRKIDYLIMIEKLNQLKKPFTERVNQKSKNLRLEYDSDDVCGVIETEKLKKASGYAEFVDEEDTYRWLTEGFAKG